MAAACCWSICHTTFSPKRSLVARSARFTCRNTWPSTTRPEEVHPSIATLTQVGMGAVRMRQCFPSRSTMHQRPSRCWVCRNLSGATSDRRRPQPSRTAIIARSRTLFRLVVWCRQESLRLPKGQPVARADAHRFHALHTSDSGRQLRREQPVIDRLSGQLANCRHPYNDRGRTELASFERRTPCAHGRLAEAGPRSLGVPVHEFV